MDKRIPAGSYTKRVGGQLSEEVRVTSGVRQGSVLGPTLFLEYVNDNWKSIESTIRIFADHCLIYRKKLSNKDVGNLQIDLNRLEEWAFENEIIINPAKCKAYFFT
jgi:hypothetical protein